MQIHIRLARAGDDTDRFTPFTLPDTEIGWAGASVSNALQYLQRTVDPSLGYALSCRRGLCDVCAMRIDGVVRTACTTPLRDGMRIEPARDSIRLHDTIVELSLVRKHRSS